ncbi:acyl-CoA N-acyltransferase [Phaeosphaeriaceae sp. SRC1lsM3a]|nr:acyl-CoA N-acyltransferase [Stagonospora sp. SRC1lsM3a]
MADLSAIAFRSRELSDAAPLTEILTAVYNISKYPVDGPSSFPSRFQAANALVSIVALYNGSVAGHAELQDTSGLNSSVVEFLQSQGPLSSFAALVSLFVDPRMQGKGIGARLVEEAIDRGRQEGKRLVLVVLDKDMTAIRMYERLGWERKTEYFYESKQGVKYRAFTYLAPV